MELGIKKGKALVRGRGKEEGRAERDSKAALKESLKA
jgi:hypothetical protein